eukprot:2776499-Pyramimonas_sp.AAC.2
MDLVVPCIGVDRGLPLVCDATVVSLISRNGQPRGSTRHAAGRLLLDRAEVENNTTYHDVLNSGLGSLQCLAVETHGRRG